MAIDLSDTSRELVERVRSFHTAAEAEHKQFRDHAGEFYGLYRGFNDFRDTHRGATSRDVDLAIRDAKREWGAELFIPFSFRTVETILPRMVAHRPRMLVLPQDQQALGNVENMRLTIDKQQKQIGYELVLQTIAKDGLIYGLGVQKTRWRKEYRNVRGITQSTYDPDAYVDGERERVCTFDDAVAERVDPWNFFWDPYADNVDTCEGVIHRTWRSPRFVRRMVEQGHWRTVENDPLCEWTLDDLLRMGPSTKRDEIMESRLTAEGYNTDRAQGDHLHEVWEFHDGDQVITVLDSEVPVQGGENDYGTLPFQIFRPTIVGGRLPGISEIEPIKHLQYEINTLRSQRRDAATLSLMKTFAFDENAVDADDLKFGPGLAIPINGNPRDFLFPIPTGDVPNSSYQESQEIVADIEGTSGVSDTVAGGDSGGPAAATATGVQLVQAAASKRIENKTRLLELGVVIPGGWQFLEMNQRKILEKRALMVEKPQDPNRPHLPAWEQVEIGPAELAGNMAIDIEGGSMAAENTPQRRQDAQALSMFKGDPNVDQRQLTVRQLDLHDVKHPESMLSPLEPMVPAQAVTAFLQATGQDPRVFLQFLNDNQADEPAEAA